MLKKKYKNIGIGEYFKYNGYCFLKCVDVNEDGEVDYPAVEVESGERFYFTPDVKCFVADWYKE